MLVSISALILTTWSSAIAQDSDPPSKIEVGAQFTTLSVGPSLNSEIIPASFFSALGQSREAGFGGRFTVNLGKYVAADSEVNFFPRNEIGGGYMTQGLFGVKAGRRFKKIGVFVKARPGFASFSEVTTEEGIDTIGTPPLQFNVPHFELRRRTFFAMDVGGVIEIYPSHRVFARVDLGDTIIRYGKGLFFDSDENTPPWPEHTRHVFQFSAGIGIRFK